MHENEHCRAGVSKTKSKIRTSAEANEGLQLKSDFVIPKGMTVWGSSSRTGSRQTKASAARIAPILIPKGWKNAAAYPMRCGTKPRSTLLRQASAAGDFGPRGASAATVSRTTAFLDSIRLCGRKADRFPHLAASRAGRQRPPSAPPHRIVRRRQRLSNLPDLPAKSRRIAIIDSRTSSHSARDGSAHPLLRRTGSCGGGDVPVLVSYGSREPYGKSSGIAEPKTFT